MEFKVIVTHELGTATLNALTAILTGNAAAAAKTPAKAKTQDAAEMAVVKEAEEVKAPKAKADKPVGTKPGPKGKNAMAAEAFAGLDAEDQLEAIKTEVTKHSKKGKTADIKEMLSHFGAARASELDPANYADMYTAIIAYGGGSSVADALASVGGESDDDLL